MALWECEEPQPVFHTRIGTPKTSLSHKPQIKRHGHQRYEYWRRSDPISASFSEIESDLPSRCIPPASPGTRAAGSPSSIWHIHHEKRQTIPSRAHSGAQTFCGRGPIQRAATGQRRRFGNHVVSELRADPAQNARTPRTMIGANARRRW